MSKPAAIFVAAAMAVTAGCVSVIASRGVGLGLPESILAGFVALAIMAVTHLAFLRSAPQNDGRIDDIDDLVTELQSRLETVEARLAMLDGAGAERARAATRPLVEEIAALGGLVTSIAKEVASHDVAIAKLKNGVPAPQPAPPPPAGAPAEPAPVWAEPPRAAEPELRAPELREPEPRRPVVPTRPPASAPARVAPPALQPAPEPLDIDAAPARPVDDGDVARRFERAFAENRIEPYLQPIVGLPGRRPVHYEALARIVERDGVMSAADFLPAIGARVADLDQLTIERALGVAERLAARSGGAVFVNLSPQTLGDRRVFGEIDAMLEQRQDVARQIVIELRQSDLSGLAAASRQALDGLVERGAKLSIDDALDIRLDPRALVRQGVRFVKVPATRLLDPEAVQGAAIHPADLAGLLSRHGVDLIATHVEDERTVPELLDMEVRFAQGALFGTPRPVRPAADGPAPEHAVPAAAAARLVPRAAAR